MPALTNGGVPAAKSPLQSPHDGNTVQLVSLERLQLLHVAATLGIADLLEAGPRPASELATACGCRAEELYRILRALSNLGIVRELAGRRFELPPDEIGGVTIAIAQGVQLRGMVRLTMDLGPIDRWLAEQDSHPPLGRQQRIRVADCAKKTAR